MFNGCLQVLNSGLVPGNRNADNIDKIMEKFDYVVYPSRSIQTDGIKAFSVTSFGFGQKGAQAIGIHPKYLFAALDQAQYAAYKVKVEARQKKAYRYFHNGLINNSLFVAKDKSPYDDTLESKVLLNPDARVALNEKTSQLTYPTKAPVHKTDQNTKDMVEYLAKATVTANTRVGVDVESIEAINLENDTFIQRNFTEAEQKYCRQAASPQASFAGRWSAKEAVFKSLGVCGKGAGAALKDIEIINDTNGTPVVTLHGDAAAAAKQAGVVGVTVSISHSDSQAVAVAQATVN
ncbi:fatty acid synthase subunit alpha reductase [Coccidioides immitis H538.4]|nr:fatty acid synthase subunit alpha reductase [Coccidioides immitis H538.4]